MQASARPAEKRKQLPAYSSNAEPLPSVTKPPAPPPAPTGGASPKPASRLNGVAAAPARRSGRGLPGPIDGGAGTSPGAGREREEKSSGSGKGGPVLPSIRRVSNPSVGSAILPLPGAAGTAGPAAGAGTVEGTPGPASGFPPLPGQQQASGAVRISTPSAGSAPAYSSLPRPPAGATGPGLGPQFPLPVPQMHGGVALAPPLSASSSLTAAGAAAAAAPTTGGVSMAMPTAAGSRPLTGAAGTASPAVGAMGGSSGPHPPGGILGSSFPASVPAAATSSAALAATAGAGGSVAARTGTPAGPAGTPAPAAAAGTAPAFGSPLAAASGAGPGAAAGLGTPAGAASAGGPGTGVHLPPVTVFTTVTGAAALNSGDLATKTHSEASYFERLTEERERRVALQHEVLNLRGSVTVAETERNAALMREAQAKAQLQEVRDGLAEERAKMEQEKQAFAAHTLDQMMQKAREDEDRRVRIHEGQVAELRRQWEGDAASRTAARFKDEIEALKAAHTFSVERMRANIMELEGQLRAAEKKSHSLDVGLHRMTLSRDRFMGAARKYFASHVELHRWRKLSIALSGKIFLARHRFFTCLHKLHKTLFEAVTTIAADSAAAREAAPRLPWSGVTPQAESETWLRTAKRYLRLYDGYVDSREFLKTEEAAGMGDRVRAHTHYLYVHDLAIWEHIEDVVGVLSSELTGALVREKGWRGACSRDIADSQLHVTVKTQADEIATLRKQMQVYKAAAESLPPVPFGHHARNFASPTSSSAAAAAAGAGSHKRMPSRLSNTTTSKDEAAAAAAPTLPAEAESPKALGATAGSTAGAGAGAAAAGPSTVSQTPSRASAAGLPSAYTAPGKGPGLTAQLEDLAPPGTPPRGSGARSGGNHAAATPIGAGGGGAGRAGVTSAGQARPAGAGMGGAGASSAQAGGTSGKRRPSGPRSAGPAGTSGSSSALPGNAAGARVIPGSGGKTPARIAAPK